MTRLRLVGIVSGLLIVVLGAFMLGVWYAVELPPLPWLGTP